MGITTSLYIAGTGLDIARMAMDVISHNISNVNTEGYSRQSLDLITMQAMPTRVGPAGLGVDASSISRSYDKYIQRNLTEKSSDLAKYEAQKMSMDSIEAIFNESAGNGINEALSEFWSAWQDLANNPEGSAERLNLLEKADTLTQSINVVREDLDQIKQDINTRIQNGLIQVNALTREIAALNLDITAQEAGGIHNANDLRDQRDQLIKELGEYIDIQYYEDPADGSISVLTPKGTPLVSGGTSYDLKAETDSFDGNINVLWERENGGTVDITDTISTGKIGGWIELRDDVMNDIYRQFEAFTGTLIAEVNRQHSQGAGLVAYTDAVSTYDIEDHASLNVELEGYDNDLQFKALFTGQDGENVGIRFIKASSTSDELRLTTERVGNRFNITVVLPVNANGQVTATAEDVARLIREDRSTGLDIPAPFPPAGPPYHAGDLIEPELARGETGTGLALEFTNPADAEGFSYLNFELQNVLEYGDQIEFKDYATTQTELDGDDNDLIFTVNPDWLKSHPDQDGENIGIEYVDSQPPPLNQSLSINVSGNLIQIIPATDSAGNIITSANDVIALINATPSAQNLVNVQRATGNTGEGVITGMTPQYLDRSASFDLVVYDPEGEPHLTTIYVRPTDTKEDVMAQINAIEIDGYKPISAGDYAGTSESFMRIQTEAGYEFAFGNDSSNALMALGFNTFFTGSTASTIGVSESLSTNISLIAAGRIDEEGYMTSGDNTNALDLADIKDQKFEIDNQKCTISEAFNSLDADVGATTSTINRNHDFNANLVDQILAQRDMVSAVNLDEEMSDLLKFQYMYQAAAKMISTVDEMLQSLLAVV